MTSLCTRASLWRLLTNQELMEQTAAFGSHVMLNLSLFGVLFIASIVFSPEQFAELSLVNGYIMLGAMLLDFGISNAALKLSIEHDRQEFVQINLMLKAGLFVACLLAFTVVAFILGPTREVVVLLCASALAFWYANRIVEQFNRHFFHFATLNLALALARIAFGGLSLFTKSWVLVVVALHVVALASVSVSTVIKLLGFWRHVDWRAFQEIWGKLLRLAPAFFLFSAFYSALPVITQTAIYLRGDSSATGAFGIVMLAAGVVTLLAGTLRIYLQPQIILGSLGDVKVFGLGTGSLHIIVVAFAGAVLASIVAVGFLATWFYGPRFPQVGTYLMIYAGTSCVVDALGFYNIRVMRQGLIWFGLWVNVLRVGLTAISLVVPGLSPLWIVVWSAFVLVAGELLLLLLLTIVDRGQQSRLAG